jgi:Tol biopolymer transport system component
LIAAACSGGSHCVAQDIVTDVSQGTNMALALSPDGNTLAIDLMGQLWTLPATGGAASRLLATDSIARNPRYSPDGRHLVYQQYSQGQWDLWLLDLASTTRRRLTGPPYDEREPDFSPAGDAVYFASGRGGGDEIWRLDLNAGGLTRVTYDGDTAAWPSVSERHEIAYVSQAGSRWTLMLTAENRPTTAVYTSPNPLRAPSWRPGGGVITIAEQTGPRKMDLQMILLSDEPVVKTLTRGEDVFGFRPAWKDAATLVYSADGQIWWRTLANASRYPVPLFAGVAVNRASHALRTSAVPADGPHPVQGIRSPAWSQPGRLRAYTALGDLWLQVGDRDPRQLTDDVHVDIDPDISPDERRVVFASDRDGAMNLWSLDLETRISSQLTHGAAKAYAPAISADGQRLAYLETDGFGPWGPSRLKLMDLGAGAPPQTLAIQLLDASRPSWSASGGAVTLTARNPSFGSNSPDNRARLELTPEDGSARWSAVSASEEEPEQPPPGPLTWTPAPVSGSYVIQVDRLFDGVRTEYRRHMDIHVDGRRITDVVARGLKPLPPRVIDARGYTIVPGFIDLHAHQSAIAGERLGRIWLAYGVTTVREVGSQPGDALERREAWLSGKRAGPRLLLSARASEAAAWPSSDDAGRPSFDVLEIVDHASPMAFESAAVRDARRFGIPIFGEDLFPAVRYGINALEHIGRRDRESPYDLERSALGNSYADVLGVLAQSGAAVTPTLAAFGGFAVLARQPAWLAEPAFQLFYSRDERLRWQSLESVSSSGGLEQTIAQLVRNGGRVAAGSDAPSVPYGLGLHAELSVLSAAGLPSDQALRLVTAEAALALGLERELGTVEAGKLADLVVIDGNPLMNLRDSLRIVAVVKDGVWIQRSELLNPPRD